MLRKIRLTLAVVFWAGITLRFLDFTGIFHTWLGWMAKIQFLPALLAANVVVITVLVAATLLLGRIYCSVVCPMGVVQDMMSRIGRLFRSKSKRKSPYSYSPAVSWLRYTVLGLFIVAFIAGIGALVAVLAPYSYKGRIASNLFQPVWLWGNNVLAALAERAESYSFYHVDIWMKGLFTWLIAATTFAILFFLAVRNGRTYCNTVCPVGTVLGLLAKYAWFKPVIDPDKCIQCGKCSRNCKASCIDFQKYAFDYSRCVTCGDCISVCRSDALHYQHLSKAQHRSLLHAAQANAEKIAARKAAVRKRTEEKANPAVAAKKEAVDTARRTLITATTIMAATSLANAQRKAEEEVVKMDGGYADIIEKVAPKRGTPITPPGAKGARNMALHCTACQLCVSECPNGVLRPSTGWTTFMQPTMSYETGYCRPECNRCSQVCPTGAIRPLTVEAKTAVQIGHAVWNKAYCIPLIDGVSCGNCARHCPSGAIQMVPSDPDDANSLSIPVVNEERCIGCGACENLCPARPLSAIYVEGHEMHREI